MAERMSDEEVLCAWMEPRPTHFPYCQGQTDGGWWSWSDDWEYGVPQEDVEVRPRSLTLDALHLVEDRLSEEQKREYDFALMRRRDPKQYVWLFSVPDRIVALASVLRSEVEKC